MPNTLQILVVDNHAYFRESLVSFLREQPLIEVVGEAKDGLEASEMATELSPNIVVMDIRMPRQNGIEAARSIKGQNPSVKIVLFSIYDYEVYRREGLETADRFIPKQRLFEDLVGVIKELSIINSA